MDDLTKTFDDIQEGEVVESKVLSNDESGEGVVLQNLEGLIKRSFATLEKLSVELKAQNEIVQSILDNDSTYQQHLEASKQALKLKSATKKEIEKRPDVLHVALKVKELKNEIKEIKESQSSYLSEYQRLSGSNEIQTDDGVVRKIVYSAKLVKSL